MKEEKYYSISEINNYIKELFDNIIPFNNILLKGEISNCRGRNKSGHIYFSLKDSKSQISAVMFKYDTLSLQFEPKDGDEVIVRGTISVYPPSGSYQIICRNITLFGKGDLLLQKEELKKKLYQEGLFNLDHKLELPKYPMNIAIITGKNSAAYKDLHFNITRRFPLCEIKPFYSLVQGQEAPKDLIKHLKEAIDSKPDLIIIGRGGGAVDDLSAFDDEMLVRELYKCNIPTISAVGHEINQSLCDLVCDKHVSTPTGAAELAVPDINNILEDLEQMKNYSSTIIERKLRILSDKITILERSKCLTSIDQMYDLYLEKIDKYDNLLTNLINNKVDKEEKKLSLLENTLSLLNPKNILSKGYSIIYKDGEVIRNINSIKPDDKINIVKSDGEVIAKVEEVNPNGK